ncbi:FG-GAP-like repeat-containing protein [Flavobacterium sp.]|uniref:CRTAC1 family protein n=1 Tax=Flavobacterium sp. TaxID=239 RepID=UPI0035AF8D12
MKKITFLILILSCQFSIAQSSCATAIPVAAGITTVPNLSGSVSTTTCTTSNATLTNWYSYTPTQNFTVTITSDLAINICKDTYVSIYSGTCSSFTCVAFDDDAGTIACNDGSNTNSYLSVVSFTALAGNTYYIAWDNRWNGSGFDFQLTEQPIVAPPISFTTSPITSSSTICCVSDMNGDFLDDIVTVQSNQMTVLTQKTTGGFDSNVYSLPGLTATPSWSIASGDFDKNGFNDLVFGSGSRVAVIKANATGTGYTEIAYPQNIFTQRTNFVDINNDGNLDLFACHDVAQSHAYRNDGAGNLIFDISFFPTLAVGGNYQSQWSDIDNDGDFDMYLSKCRGGAPVGDAQRINLLYLNNGNGTFTENGAAAGVNDGSQSWASAIEDYDNDGDMDILLSNISDTNKFYRNNGDGTFTDVYSTTGIDSQVGSWEIQAADFNNDGWIDFLWQNSKELWINDGDGTFSGYDVPFNEGGIGDLNNDGFLDVQTGGNVYYSVPNDNHWITINLHGIQSNYNGIGARIELYGAWGKQIREIKSGNGFSHQSTLNAHFGIGSETEITQLIIKWPSGIVDTISNPASDSKITVVEGSTLSNEQFNSNEISLYPNPAENEINIHSLNQSISFKEFKIFDLSGKMIFETTNVNKAINISKLATGQYIFLATDANSKNYSQKFLKK